MAREAFDVREFLPLLDDPLKTNDGWRSYCPCHNDGAKHRGKPGGDKFKGRSLNLTAKFGFKCFNGCDAGAVMIALRAKDQRPKKTNPAKPQSWKYSTDPVAVYEYVDPFTLELLAVKARWQDPNPLPGEKPDKSFGWRTPTGSYREGLAEGGIDLLDLPLWGSESVLLASEDQRVFFVEGEKAAMAVRKQEELAICGAWGAGQKQFGNNEMFEVLRGRHVILWPDNDAIGNSYMAGVKRVLRRMAKSVVVVNAPGPEHGDAVEYFATKGNSVDKLLSGSVIETTTDIIDHDHFRVRIPIHQGKVTFDFAGIQSAKGDTLETDMTVTVEHPEIDVVPFNQWINTKSLSTRSSLKTALAGQFGGGKGSEVEINWTAVISEAWEAARHAFDTTDRALSMKDLPHEDQQRWQIHEIVPWGTSSIFFGAGSALKSYMLLSMAVHVMLGTPWQGHEVHQGPVMIVDYEDPAAIWYRVRRILLGLGLDPEIADGLPLIVWPPEGQPLAEQALAIRRSCERNEVVWLIIDSAMPACSGEPEKSEPTISFFRGIDKIGLTTSIISHASRDEIERGLLKPYGNVTWENKPRRTWAMMRTDDEGQDTFVVTMHCRKTNLKKPLPTHLQISFEGESGPMTISPASASQRAFSVDADKRIRIQTVLRQSYEPMTINSLATRLRMEPATVKTILLRHRGDNPNNFKQNEQKGPKGATLWSVISE